MTEKEKIIYSKIGDILGIDILLDFKKNGCIEGGDREYNENEKRKMLNLLSALAFKYDIKFFNADNLIDREYGCSDECCGTDFLRNHKIWGGCFRSQVFANDAPNYSKEFGKCLVNFTRSTKNQERTINDVCEEYIKNEERKIRNKKCVQLSLF